MPAEDRIPVAARVAAGDSPIVAVHCSENGFRPALDEFLTRRFPGKACDQIAMPGGAWWLARVAAARRSRLKRIVTGDFHEIRGQVEAMVKRQSVERVVLIAHQECGWYGGLHQELGAGALVREQAEDLLAAREEVERWAGADLAVEGHILTIDGAGAVTFRAVF